MKTDKELLELAAKACNEEIKPDAAGMLTLNGRRWNPIIDDGDALRLAVKLCMTISHHSSSVWTQAYFDGIPTSIYAVPVDSCTISATRRAIVRAAAAIGEKL